MAEWDGGKLYLHHRKLLLIEHEEGKQLVFG